MNTLHIGQAQLRAYQGRQQTAKALAAGIRHPLARLAAWVSRRIAQRRIPDGPSYKDYPFFK